MVLLFWKAKDVQLLHFSVIFPGIFSRYAGASVERQRPQPGCICFTCFAAGGFSKRILVQDASCNSWFRWSCWEFKFLHIHLTNFWCRESSAAWKPKLATTLAWQPLMLKQDVSKPTPYHRDLGSQKVNPSRLQKPPDATVKYGKNHGAYDMDHLRSSHVDLLCTNLKPRSAPRLLSWLSLGRQTSRRDAGAGFFISAQKTLVENSSAGPVGLPYCMSSLEMAFFPGLSGLSAWNLMNDWLLGVSFWVVQHIFHGSFPKD